VARAGSPGFVGQRLVQARKVRGMSRIDLAREVAVSRQMIALYETGQQTPGPDSLERIAKALNFGTLFFTWPIPETSRQGPVFSRSMVSATKAARERVSVPLEWIADLARYVAQWIGIPKVDFPVFDVPSDPGRISDEQIEKLAAATRRHWGMGDGPIGNVAWLAENKGAIVVRLGLDADKLDGQSQWVDGRPHILLNADKGSAVRSRFDVGHEIGHLVAHRNVPRDAINNPVVHKLMEDQANAFASSFLLPRNTFASEVHSISLDQFRMLKERWKVAIGAMLMRAIDIGLVPEKRAEYLWISYSRKGWRKWEPLDDDLPVEQPRLLRQALTAILSHKLQTSEDVIASIPVGQGYVEELMGLERGFFNEEAQIVTLPKRHEPAEAAEVPIGRGDVIRFPGAFNRDRD
jgi:Zn-dependent peptidase ImmA (M78 family)/DNA-binding XRE family transcriptional regulator